MKRVSHWRKPMLGLTFGRLKVVREHHTDSRNRIFWECVCLCGEKRIVAGIHLRSGNTKSCGCYQKDRAASTNFKHGHNRGRKQRSPTYTSWVSMVTRCCNDNRVDWKYYGGRGIRVCKRWLGKRGFENFVEDMGVRPAGMSIDRVDPDKGYKPSNCRWATKLEQARNTRRSRMVESRFHPLYGVNF